ncbi:MAG: hypothetical protein ACI4D8_06085 [Wujia sp.]
MGFLDKIRAYLAEEEPADDLVDLGEQAYKALDSEAVAEPQYDLEAEEDTDEELLTDEATVWDEDVSQEKKSLSIADRLKGLLRRKPKTELPKEKPREHVNVRAGEAQAVKDFCEQLVDVTVHSEELTREYALVTSYLTDIQRIEELPVQIAEEIVDLAVKIDTLNKNRENYSKSEKLLPMDQYNVMATYEDDVVNAIKNLNDMEMRDGMLKNDMGYLEGEKEDLKYMRNEYLDGIARVRGIIIAVLSLFLGSVMIMTAYAFSSKESVTLYALIAGVITMLSFAIAYVRYSDLKRSIQECDAKLKRAVSLQNKVKAKYINNTNTVDYIYDKYGVNSCRELEYMWEQYNTMVRDAKQYEKANANLKRFCDDLTLRLDKLGIEDPEVWTKQVNALIDRREMVEIKHGLNVRRQKLRDSMVTCEKIKSNAVTALRAELTENPGMDEFIRKQLAPYGIELE